jgi:hypothetical protein
VNVPTMARGLQHDSASPRVDDGSALVFIGETGRFRDEAGIWWPKDHGHLLPDGYAIGMEMTIKAADLAGSRARRLSPCVP